MNSYEIVPLRAFSDNYIWTIRDATHAIAAAIREALACKETGEEKVILTALCGHGHFDLAAYDQYLNGAIRWRN